MALVRVRLAVVSNRLACCRRLLCTNQSTENGQGTSDNQTTNSGGHSEEETLRKIVEHSLPFVHQYGWSTKAIVEGANAAGLSSAAHGLLPRGGSDLVLHFIEKCNGELVEHMKSVNESEDRKDKSDSEFIRNSLEFRLRMIIPYMEKWPQAMGLMVLPQNARDALCSGAVMVDDIWYYAGDKSADFNWYTKRAILGKIYYATELYMIRDKSEDYGETWKFLDNRIRDITNFGRLTAQIKVGCDNVGQLFSGAFSFNAAGLNSRGPRLW